MRKCTSHKQLKKLSPGPTTHQPPTSPHPANRKLIHHKVTITVCFFYSLKHFAGERRGGKWLVKEHKAPSLTIQEKRIYIPSYWNLQTLNLKGQNLPPSVVMSQYALNGCPEPFGSIQYSPFFCALVYFQMSLQETPGNSGDEPFLTDRREEM